MDITRFNKDLANKITQAKRFEKSNEIKSAIKLWLEISEMTINLSKSPNLNVSFKTMLINRTKHILEHIKYLKSGKVQEKPYIEAYPSQQEDSEFESSFEYEQEEEIQEQEEIDKSNFNHKNHVEVVQDSEYKNLPKGFKEIKTSEDFEIITPHDENFVKNQLDKAFEGENFSSRTHETNDASKTKRKLEIEQPERNKYKICFACGYDKNSAKDKICKNCGITLD
jgi:hypothetical protein